MSIDAADSDAGPAARGPAGVPSGFRMPAEWAPHERTVMGWPARAEMWGEHFDAAKRDYAEIANTIAAFEPVLMVAHPAQEAEARAALSGDVEVVAIPLDDSWMRDCGPIGVVRDGGEGGNEPERVGVHFGFNGWGDKFHPYDADAEVGGHVLEHLGIECHRAPFVLEGGSIAVDGEGTLVTTEQCLLHPSRNPAMSRAEIEHALRAWLGVERVVWLGQGLIEDLDTDGHVDNICAYVSPGRVLLQTVADEANPNYENCQENVRRLRDAGLEVVELDVLPYVPHEGPPTVVPYVNYYVCNGGVVVPVSGAEQDDEVLARIGSLYPGREVVPGPGITLALGGGGIHCITQQVPRV